GELVRASPFVEGDQLVDRDAELAGNLERVVTTLDRVVLRGGGNGAVDGGGRLRCDRGLWRADDERGRALAQIDRRFGRPLLPPPAARREQDHAHRDRPGDSGEATAGATRRTRSQLCRRHQQRGRGDRTRNGQS